MTDPTPTDPFAELRRTLQPSLRLDLTAPVEVNPDRLRALLAAYDAAVEGLEAIVEGVDRSYPQMLHQGERRALDKAEAALARARGESQDPQDRSTR